MCDKCKNTIFVLQKYSIIFIYKHKDITWVSRHMKWKSRQLSRQFSVSFVNSHGFVLAPHTSQLTMHPALQRAHAYCFQMSCISPTFSFVFLCFKFSYFNLGWFVTQFCWAWHVDGDHLVTKAKMGLSWLPPWSNSSTCCTIVVLGFQCLHSLYRFTSPCQLESLALLEILPVRLWSQPSLCQLW